MKKCLLIPLIFLTCTFSLVLAQSPSEDLAPGFLTPPLEAKPRTWWHWTAGNVTKEGITKDLEWMKRVGIGGFQAFDISFGAGQSTDQKTVFMTPEWLEAVRHSAAEADRLGLEMTMVTSAGWSETGGPWVKPEEAMKKVVWSTMTLTGGKKFFGKLPLPPTQNGPIRNLSRHTGFGISPDAPPDPTFYADHKVLAFRTPPDESNIIQRNPTVTSSEGAIDKVALLDDDLTTGIPLPVSKGNQQVWIQYEFTQSFDAQSFSIATGLMNIYGSKDLGAGYLQASDDGVDFRTLVTFPGPQHDIRAIPVRTFSFPRTSAKFYRIVFVPGSGLSTVGDFGSVGFSDSVAATFDLTEALLHSGGRVHRWEDKAHFAPMFEFETLSTPSVAKSSVILRSDIIDLTSKMTQDGTLTWDAPPGDWTVFRMGYSLTGAKNGPAVPAGTGYEVDKLSRKHLESYYQQYTAPIAQVLGPLYGKSLQYWLTDSFEADAQNWTEDMPQEFRKRRGYDLTPYLPVLSGRIVESAEVSDRFLWDFRRTIADLLAENHYKALADLAHQQGIKLYGESAGISLPIIQDALQNKGRVDIPMGEFGMTQGLGSGRAWMSPADLDSDHAYRGAGDRLNAHQADIREAASAAHIYGKKFVAAESWTGGGYEAPSSMKLMGDYWNTQGVNRFVFHTSTHQPLDTKPGNAMVGMHMHRNITWAEQAAPFVTYLARNSYLLQQGKFVADIAYYLGEGIPSAVPYWKKLAPAPPEGYDYDFINTEILLDSLSVKEGSLVLPNGMRYQVLVLPETNQMTPHVLHKIKTLIASGATVVGPKPVASPSLTGYSQVDREIALMGNEIWGDADGELIYHHAYGKGDVYWGVPLASLMAEKGIEKDLDYTRPHVDTYLSWIHRKTPTADIYFISNLRSQSEDVELHLRVDGKVPELWHSNTGKRQPVSYSIKNGITTVYVNLTSQESVLVVLQQEAKEKSLQLPSPTFKQLTTLNGPWQITFPAGMGAPDKITLDKLYSLSAHPEDGVKYFGGTATYTKEMVAPKAWFRPGTGLVLDLGEVKDIAEVIVNGQSLGIVWKPPYRMDITESLKVGTNNITIQVTNQWTNRIAGDVLHPDQKVLSGTGLNFGPPDTTLIESGLIGPVVLLSVSR